MLLSIYVDSKCWLQMMLVWLCETTFNVWAVDIGHKDSLFLGSTTSHLWIVIVGFQRDWCDCCVRPLLIHEHILLISTGSGFCVPSEMLQCCDRGIVQCHSSWSQLTWRLCPAFKAASSTSSTFLYVDHTSSLTMLFYFMVLGQRLLSLPRNVSVIVPVFFYSRHTENVHSGQELCGTLFYV